MDKSWVEFIHTDIRTKLFRESFVWKLTSYADLLGGREGGGRGFPVQSPQMPLQPPENIPTLQGGCLYVNLQNFIKLWQVSCIGFRPCIYAQYLSTSVCVRTKWVSMCEFIKSFNNFLQDKASQLPPLGTKRQVRVASKVAILPEYFGIWRLEVLWQHTFCRGALQFLLPTDLKVGSLGTVFEKCSPAAPFPVGHCM